MTVVSGVYHDASSVTKAVRSLLSESVPADSIRVTIREGSGRWRSVEIADETGVFEGAKQGAVVGAVVGGLVMVIAAVWVAVRTGDGLLPVGPVSAALSGALGGAAAGVMLGALVGMGRWKGLPDLDESVWRSGSVVVSVRSDALAGTAEEVLVREGAGEVRVSDEGGIR